MTKRQPKPDPAVFVETPRDPVKTQDVERAVRQVLRHPAKPVAKSENREPTQAELNQRWKLTRRG